MSSSSNVGASKPKPVSKSRPLYLSGIALTVIGFVLGIAIVALHYGTSCSKTNMFACHSLYNMSGGNSLPLLTTAAGLLFIIGIILAFLYGPRMPASTAPATGQT